MPLSLRTGSRPVSTQDPDIVALFARLGLRGLRYHGFQRVVTGRRVLPAELREQEAPATARAPAPEADAVPPPAAVMVEAVIPAPAPLPQTPPVAAPVVRLPLPAAAVPAAPVAVAAAAAPPAFPLLGQALARAAGMPPPAAAPAASRPYASLRLAVAGDTAQAGH